MGLRLDNGKFYIDETAAIIYAKGADAPPHTHDFIELMYVLRGKCVHVVDGVEYPATHGDMLLINYGSLHSIVGNDDMEYVNILIKPEIMDEGIRSSENAFSLLSLKDFEEFSTTVNQKNCFIHFEGNEREQVEGLLRWLLSEQNSSQAGSQLMIRSGFNMLFILVFRKMALSLQPEFRGVDEHLLAYIREHCHERLRLEDLAGMCGYNTCYFSRLFTRSCGKSFKAYVIEARIELACRLLEDTDMSVERIIGEVGFSDRMKFFKEFSQRMGMTPMKYRKSKE